MRVTGGTYRSRILSVPPGDDIRPTADKVRLAVFNALFSRGFPEGAVVLDVFCGSGALGIEALSRGASCCTFLDKSRDSIAVCRANIEALKVGDGVQLLQVDVTKAKAKPAGVAPADLVFLDPPYRQNLAVPALEALAAGGWLAGSALCVLETEREALPALPAGFTLSADRAYGSTRIMFLDYSTPV